MVIGKRERLRVLYISKTSTGAFWAERQTRDLVQLGVDVHIALPPGGPRIPKYEAAGVTVHLLQSDLPLRHPLHIRRRLADIRALVAHVDPDIIHALHVGVALSVRLALGKDHGTPRIFQVPGPLHLEHPLPRRVEIATAGRADYWIGTCQWICDRYLRSGIAADRLFLSDYGVDVETYGAQHLGVLRAELGVGPETALIGMVGFMYAPKRFLGQRRGLKGHEDLIDALAIVMESRPDVMGVFIGGAWGGATGYERRVHAYGRQRCGDRIRFLGTRDNLAALLPDLDLAVQPSHTESIAATAIEAQLSGVPLVASDVGGLTELITSGETGWLVPARNPARLAETILAVLGDPERRCTIARQGQDRARARFDAHMKARQVLAIYQTI